MLITENIEDITVLSFQNISKFNVSNADPIKEKIGSIYNTPNAKVVLDLSGIEFIDSTGFGVFLSIMKTANNNYGFFKICNVSERVMELFKLLQLHNVFEIYKTREDALKSSELI